MSLAEKLRRAREIRCEVGCFIFLVRRPTDLEMLELHGKKFGRAVLPFVVGWEKVSELSMLDGGTPHPLDFDADACTEWLSDRLDLLGPLVDRVIEAYEAHAKALEDAAKN